MRATRRITDRCFNVSAVDDPFRRQITSDYHALNAEQARTSGLSAAALSAFVSVMDALMRIACDPDAGDVSVDVLLAELRSLALEHSAEAPVDEQRVFDAEAIRALSQHAAVTCVAAFANERGRG